MQQEHAETIALQALAWIAAEESLLQVFLGSTGAGLDDLRGRAADPEFQIAVLDFLMLDDAWLTGFCDARELAYDIPPRARAALPGGQDMHWT